MRSRQSQKASVLFAISHWCLTMGERVARAGAALIELKWTDFKCSTHVRCIPRVTVCTGDAYGRQSTIVGSRVESITQVCRKAVRELLGLGRRRRTLGRPRSLLGAEPLTTI